MYERDVGRRKGSCICHLAAAADRAGRRQAEERPMQNRVAMSQGIGSLARVARGSAAQDSDLRRTRVPEHKKALKRTPDVANWAREAEKGGERESRRLRAKQPKADKERRPDDYRKRNLGKASALGPKTNPKTERPAY